MAADTHAVAFAVWAHGRGLRFASYTGIVGQLVESDKGTQYRNDMGRAIPWWYETGWLHPERRCRVSSVRAIVGNLLASSPLSADPYAVRFESYCDDQGFGRSTFTYDRPAARLFAEPPVPDDWSLAPWVSMPGVRHYFTFAARNSAQRIESFDFALEPVDGGGGN